MVTVGVILFCAIADANSAGEITNQLADQMRYLQKGGEWALAESFVFNTCMCVFNDWKWAGCPKRPYWDENKI